ncbi:hypothetical protein ACLKA7_013567 [Drosophila subpalustris]
MLCKLVALSLGPLLITILSAQLVQSQSYGGGREGGGPGYSQYQRPDGHYHHRHNNHDGRSHHGHGHSPNQYYDEYQGAPRFRPGQDPRHGGSLYGDWQQGERYPGQPGAGHRGQRPGQDYEIQQGPGYRPGPGYGGHRQGVGFGGQPRDGFVDQPRPGHGGGVGPFQPRPDQSVFQPRPHSGEFNFQHQGNDPAGNAGSPLQPRPGHGYSDPTPFHQSRSTSKQLATLAIRCNHDQDMTPRPGKNSVVFQHPDKDQSGNAGNRLQPRPGQGNFDSTQFPQQGDGQSGNPLQPRPHSNGQDSSDVNFQTAGNAGNPLQPRPGQRNSDSTPFQQPENGQSGNTIQPRPTDFSKFHFQEPSEGVSPKPIQPLPGQGLNQGAGGEQIGSTIQPRPKSDSYVEDNIQSIFNTREFLSPQLSGEGHGIVDPKNQTKGANPSLENRFLFDTTPQCTDGRVLRDGHCRSSA